MHTSCYIFLCVCAVTVVLAGESTEKKVRVTPTSTQSILSVAAYDTPPGTHTFIVSASLKDQDMAPLSYGSLRVYDGVKLISSCVVEHGYEIRGRVTFGFAVATNYCDSSKFSVSYGTNYPESATYWFYLKDYCHAK